MTTLRLGTFTKSLLIAEARRTGRLLDADLDVEEVSVLSSPQQFTELANGSLDAVLTSPDNVLAYQYLRENPLGRHLDLRIWCGIDRGLGLSLWRGPQVGAELSAPTLGVDVATSGFAFVAYELLRRLGVNDYTTVALGSTPKRATALIDGGCDVTILNAGNDLRAASAGATCIGRVSELGPYVATVLASRRAITPSVDHAVSQLRDVLLESATAICSEFDPEKILFDVEVLLGLEPLAARDHVEILSSPLDGYVTSGEIEMAALETLVQLRQRHRPDPDLTQITRKLPSLVDAGYLGA